MTKVEKSARKGIARLTQWFNLMTKEYGTAWPYHEAEIIIDIVGENWPDIKVYVRHLQEVEKAAKEYVRVDREHDVSVRRGMSSFSEDVRLAEAKGKLMATLKQKPQRTKQDAEWEGP